ncbi:MAG TPA: DUF6781 family protein [Pirellulales bacterium]|nr:DUF6781 family protein [Pirellulales bacterium]
MATKSPGMHPTKARAKQAAEGTAVRDRVRKLSIAALRDRNLSMSDISKLVHEVLEGAVEAVNKSIPASSRNVLREVFDGLSDGVRAIASAGSATATEARKQSQAMMDKNVSAVTKRIRAANTDFLTAVKNFAKKTSRDMQKELDVLVARAERTGPKVAASMRKTATAADGRLMELSGETARAGIRVARRAAGALAMGAGGALEGLAEAITPKSRRATSKKSKPARVQKKKTATKASRNRHPSKRQSP